ncbi:MAG: prepilin peptidase [Candidatus Nealsonbacteria bacterium]|nr:prepilin peptidase [Candidatus Nealsonbacteria bacterium]
MELRLALVFLLGACIGSLANLGVYRLAWSPRPIGPWTRPHDKAAPRRWTDRLPIVGWLGLRRESALHGPGFWIRPMLLELLLGTGLAALYWWEIGQQGLLPADAPTLAGRAMLILHAPYAAHLLLISLMVVAAMIDLDERIIPDTITVPGVWLGLLLAAVCPWALLPEFVPPAAGIARLTYWAGLSPETWQILQPASPEVVFEGLFPQGHPQPQGIPLFPHPWLLAAGLGCWWLWCVALMPRVWYGRYGWRRASAYFVATLVRERATYRILVMGLIGSAAIVGVWFWGGTHWTGLLAALVGMAGGGGLIWLVRVTGAVTLRREAMGFGDVTLMAMIGTFLGWQTCLLIFFIAPLCALLIGVVQLILYRDNMLPYGPFLCAGTLLTIVFWPTLWDRSYHVFAPGWLVPTLIPIFIGLMGIMLGGYAGLRGMLQKGR